MSYLSNTDGGLLSAAGLGYRNGSLVPAEVPSKP